eukprot:SAG22_NODE_5046_length_1101_cov_1.326347_1_plen_197_part_00
MGNCLRRQRPGGESAACLLDGNGDRRDCGPAEEQCRSLASDHDGESDTVNSKLFREQIERANAIGWHGLIPPLQRRLHASCNPQIPIRRAVADPAQLETELAAARREAKAEGKEEAKAEAMENIGAAIAVALDDIDTRFDAMSDTMEANTSEIVYTVKQVHAQQNAVSINGMQTTRQAQHTTLLATTTTSAALEAP